MGDRNLDFSKDGRLLTPSDIQRYFDDENVCDIVCSVNIQNVECMKAGKMLNDSIGRGINLVDINLHGIRFLDFGQLRDFLVPLIHVRRLSIDWPQSIKTHSKIRKVLEKPFRRLTYLSVELNADSAEFIPVLPMCKKLEELRLVVKPCVDLDRHSWHSWSCIEVLEDLKILQIRASIEFHRLKYAFMDMITDLHKWTDFQLVDLYKGKGLYLEKDVEICPALRKTKLLRNVSYWSYFGGCHYLSSLTAESLLTEVIRITHEDVPDEFCCLTPSPSDQNEDSDGSRGQCVLKIDEAKQLLKDPAGFEISFLYLNHEIEPNCDAHLLVSAFPNLTELVLSDILKSEDGITTTKRQKKHYQRRLRRRGNKTLEDVQDDPTNMDSSFKMVIENTPNVRELTIWGKNSYWREDEKWDMEALRLIPLWKNLRTLRLAHVPVKDGELFIHIGKECPQLEKIALRDLDINRPCSYVGNLLNMLLNHCRSLKEFSIFEQKLIKLPELFDALSNNLKLRSVRLTTDSPGEPYDYEKVISAIEQLLSRCTELIVFKCITLNLQHGLYTDPLTPALKRIKSELNRPELQFQTARSDFGYHYEKLDRSVTVIEDASTSFFAWKMDLDDF